MPYISEGQHITSPVSIRDVQRCVPVSLVRTNSSTHQTEHERRIAKLEAENKELRARVKDLEEQAA